MSRELIFLPEVSADFLEGFNYYEGLSPGRGGARFEAAFKHTLQQVQTGLVMHAVVFEHFHHVTLPRFPYHLYYRVVNEATVIVGVLYARFDPKRLEQTLKQRIG